jgi:hypothetical protein
MNKTRHYVDVGVLVALETGARLFVAKHTRDCDGTPLYSLTPEIQGEDPLNEAKWMRGYPEHSIKVVKL